MSSWAIDPNRLGECENRINAIRQERIARGMQMTADAAREVHQVKRCRICHQAVCIICNMIPNVDDPTQVSKHHHFMTGAGIKTSR